VEAPHGGQVLPRGGLGHSHQLLHLAARWEGQLTATYSGYISVPTAKFIFSFSHKSVTRR
jgi:hypothetical protein